jgi:hypothetical protein
MDKTEIHGRGHFFVKDLVNDLWPYCAGKAGDPIKSGLTALREELGPIGQRPYVKNPTGSEDAYALKEKTEQLKAALDAGDDAKAQELYGEVKADAEKFIEAIGAFVTRMT